jgi:hypothetical protein
MRRHAPLMQKARRRQNERTSANRGHTPRLWRDRPDAFDKRRIFTRLLRLWTTRHDQSIETVRYVGVTVSRDELDAAKRPDWSRSRGNNITLVTGFGFSESIQPQFCVAKHIRGTANVNNIAACPDQESDPPGPGDVLR